MVAQAIAISVRFRHGPFQNDMALYWCAGSAGLRWIRRVRIKPVESAATAQAGDRPFARTRSTAPGEGRRVRIHAGDVRAAGKSASARTRGHKPTGSVTRCRDGRPETTTPCPAATSDRWDTAAARAKRPVERTGTFAFSRANGPRFRARVQRQPARGKPLACAPAPRTTASPRQTERSTRWRIAPPAPVVRTRGLI